MSGYNFTENGCQNRMKIGNCPFWYNFETFDREMKIEQKQTQNIYLKKD